MFPSCWLSLEVVCARPPLAAKPAVLNRILRTALFAVAFAAGALAHAADTTFMDRFVDPKDGAFDVSEHLLEHRGFLPVPIIITEPAIGYGGGAALLFFRESIAEAREQSAARHERMKPPDIGVVAAFMTENGSKGAAAGYVGTLAGDRFRYLAGAAQADINIDYYGPGDVPRRFALSMPILIVQGLARIAETDWLVGPRYIYAGTSARFVRDTPSEIKPPELDAHIGRASVVVDYDSRDNMFTPSRGSYIEVDVGFARRALGSATDWDSVLARGFTYVQLGSKAILGLRADGKFTDGDVPFYVRPFITLRGIPAMRYQGLNTIVAEAELRYNLGERWALVGFGGAGRAYGGDVAFADAKTIGAGGAGFRYLIARKMGLYAGIDVARGPEQTVVYIQVGSAWR